MSELTYTNRNGYQIPNIVMDSRKNEPETLTRYGRAREKYLMEHRKAAYTAMLLKGTLWAHLTEIDQAANQQVESVMAELAMSEGVTEELKAANQIEWVQRMMQEKINMKVDTSVLDQEIANHEKQLRQFYSIKSKLMEEIDSLDPDDRHYLKRKADLDDRLYRMYDKIEDEESQMIEARAKRQAIEAEKLTGDNIYKVLMYFDKLYSAMNDVERRRVMETLISEIQIYEDRQPNGQWLKSIKFKLPIIEEDMEISLDNEVAVADVDDYIFFTNNEKIEVSVDKDSTYSGEVLLWNADDPNNPITIGYGKITPEKRSFTFSNLSSAHRYRITCDGNEELILTITDGRNVSFFGSMKNVFNMISEMILF